MEPSILLLKEIAVAANEAGSMEVAFQTALDRICALAGWPVGHVYVADEDGGRLRPTEIWYLEGSERFAEFRTVTEATTFGTGEGLPGRVLERREAVWLEDIPTVANFPRSHVAEAVGLKGAFGFPILVGDEIAAVMEFFTVESRPRDDELLEALAQAGLQLGRVVERDRAAEELERAVADRTADLTALNENLKEEIYKHEKVEAALRDSEAMYHSLVENVAAQHLSQRSRRPGRVRQCLLLRGAADDPPEELLGQAPTSISSREEQASKYVADDERR